jgi:hypothetical protein
MELKAKTRLEERVLTLKWRLVENHQGEDGGQCFMRLSCVVYL